MVDLVVNHTSDQVCQCKNGFHSQPNMSLSYFRISHFSLSCLFLLYPDLFDGTFLAAIVEN